MSEDGVARRVLAQRLSDPVAQTSILDALEYWRVTEICVLCARPAHLEEAPVLPLRVRGAWGRVLKSKQFARQLRHFGPLRNMTCYDAVFEPVCAWRPGSEVPRPFVLTVDYTPHELIVGLRLFGLGAFWADEARDALIAALRQGVKIRDRGTMIVPLVPLDCIVRDREGLPPPGYAGAATLKFLTPFSLRAGGLGRFGAVSMLMSLGNRVAGMLRWLDLDLVADWRALKQVAQQVILDGSELRSEEWSRYSQRQRDNRIPVSAATGKIVLQGELEPLLPLLLLGEDCFVGSHCALGLGRYQLILSPH